MSPRVHTLVPLLALMLAACGTTGNIKPSAKAATLSPAHGHAMLDLSGYDKVVVLDFVDATDKSGLKPEKARAFSDTMAGAVRTFPDLIAQRLRESAAFPDVYRGPISGKALVISGRITRYEEGNGALRLLVGMGAGSSYFDATTELTDAESGTALGTVATDKNSWVLGGGLAAAQTVGSFMQGAAQKIAAELTEGKRGVALAQSH